MFGGGDALAGVEAHLQPGVHCPHVDKHCHLEPRLVKVKKRLRHEAKKVKYLRGCPEVTVGALVSGRAVLLDDVGGQLGWSGCHAAAVATLEPPESVD